MCSSDLDLPERMRTEAAWIRDHLGPDVPLHLTAFHPDYRMQDRPPTPPEALRACRLAALDEGLRYVYEGNLETDARDTRCPTCGTVVIRRAWTGVQEMALREGRCTSCHAAIAGVWS